MANTHDILGNTDLALRAYIIAGGAGTDADVVTSKSSLTKTPPCTICRATNSAPLDSDPYSGNEMVTAAIIIRHLGIDEDATNNENQVPRDTAGERISNTWALFRITDNDPDAQTDDTPGQALGKAISAAAQLAGLEWTALNAEVKHKTSGFEPNADGWTDVLHLEILVAPSIISD